MSRKMSKKGLVHFIKVWKNFDDVDNVDNDFIMSLSIVTLLREQISVFIRRTIFVLNDLPERLQTRVGAYSVQDCERW